MDFNGMDFPRRCAGALPNDNVAGCLQGAADPDFVAALQGAARPGAAPDFGAAAAAVHRRGQLRPGLQVGIGRFHSNEYADLKQKLYLGP